MSEIIYLNRIPASSQDEGEIIYCHNDFNSQNKSVISKKNYCFPMFFNTKNSNQNVGKDNEIKSELKLFNIVAPRQQQESTCINNIQSTYNNSPLNLENNKENYYNINFKTKLLEPKKDSFNLFGDSLHNSDFENHSYSKRTNNKSNDQFLDEIPIISKIFTKKIKMPMNFINCNFIFNNSLCKQKVCNLYKSNLIIEKKVSFINNKPENAPNHYSKLNFNVPENFLNKFNIKRIYSENISLEQNDLILKKISLKDMEIYINKICNNNSKNHLDFSNGEYIELKKVDHEQSKNAEFLQNKRKNSSNYDENEKTNYSSKNINPNGCKRKPLKKKRKYNNKKLSLKNKKIIKNNNKKNGPKITIYLNQIQINKNRLEQFPFCQLLNVKENIKIDMLEGITEKKDIIKIKRKPEIINHQNNLKFILNKKFEIIYQKNEDQTQYILFINGINILHLILYYYYQIQEEVKLINKYHYSHASYEKLNIVRNHIEILIKKCNKIVKEISKEEH